MLSKALHLIFFPASLIKKKITHFRFTVYFVSAPEGTFPNGIRDVFRHTLKHEGIPALFKGVVPIMLRAFPANAVSIQL